MADIQTLTDLPESLREIYQPPKKLFYRGDTKALEKPCISIIGTRRASDYGESVTQKIVSELAGADITIVSGLAKGIDSFAHRAALDNGLMTIAVLGSGLRQIYPRQNKDLAEEIVENGLLISEYENALGPRNYHFPQRNRIVSALSMATVVIEAPEKSGALITARLALEQGKDVYIIPGDIDRENSLGNLRLLQKGGAYPVSSGQEILANLKEQPHLFSSPSTPKIKPKLLPEEEIIYDSLSKYRYTDLSKVIEKSKLPIQKVLAIISLLEIQGLIIKKDYKFKLLN